MNWINGFAVAIATATTFLPAPTWARVLSIGVAGALLLTSLLQDLYQKDSIRVWVQRHRLWLIILPTLVLINVTSRLYETIWDFSYGKIYTLRAESVKWISKMKEPVTILIFLRSDDKTHRYATWLQESASNLGNHLKVEIHNINRDVNLIKHYDIRSVGEAVLLAGERWVKVPDFKESTVVAGLMRLFTKEGASICFLSGHGEEDILSESANGLSMMSNTLRSFGYKVETISLVTTNDKALIQRCAMMVAIGSKTDLFPAEINVISAASGKIPILFGTDADMPQSLVDFLKTQGLDFGQNYLVNLDNVERGIPVTDIITEVQTTHPIVNQLQGLIYLPRVQNLLMGNANKNPWEAVLTIPASDPVETSTQPPQHGPFVVAATLIKDGSAPLVVVGSSNAFSNTSWKFGKNAEYTVRTIRWMLGDDTLNIPATVLIDEPLMDLTEQEVTWITNGVFYLFPGSVLLVCFLIWWRHRCA
jgi:hypothetical protein